MTGAGKSQPAIWEWAPAFGRVVWQLRFEFDQAGRYIFTASATDLGGFTAGEGKWTATSDVLNTRREGTYSFVGRSSLVMTGTIRGALTTTRNGQTLWERSTGIAQASPLLPTTPPPSVAASPAVPSPSASQAPAVAAASPTPSPQPRVRPVDRRFLVTHDSPVYAGPDPATCPSPRCIVIIASTLSASPATGCRSK